MKHRTSHWRGALLGGLLLAAGTSCLAQDKALAVGKKLFTEGAAPPCAVCHTLADAGSSGEVGPVLDEIRPDAQRVLNALRNGLGQMPSFKDTLSEEQMQAIAAYVSKVAGGAR